MNFELGFHIPDKLIKADFSVNVATKSEKEDSEEAIGAFSFVYVFHVDNIEELTKLEEDNTVTIRHRDTMEQQRIEIKELHTIIEGKVSWRNLLA